MSLHESDDSPVSYIRSPRSDLVKVGNSFRKMIFDELCFVTAKGLTKYWKRRPDEKISSIQYDQKQKLFVLSHRVDGEFTMTPQQFFTVLDQNNEQVLSEEPQLLSEELRAFMEQFGNRIKNLLESLSEK